MVRFVTIIGCVRPDIRSSYPVQHDPHVVEFFLTEPIGSIRLPVKNESDKDPRSINRYLDTPNKPSPSGNIWQ
jgi:hypothetical protein